MRSNCDSWFYNHGKNRPKLQNQQLQWAVRDPSQPWADRLAVSRNRSTESMAALSTVWTVWSEPAQSLDSLIIAWSRVWIVVWHGLDSLTRNLARVCTVRLRHFQESGKSAQNQGVQPKSSNRPEFQSRRSMKKEKR